MNNLLAFVFSWYIPLITSANAPPDFTAKISGKKLVSAWLYVITWHYVQSRLSQKQIA